MADINFNEDSGKKKPPQRDSITMVLLFVAVVAGIVVSVIGVGKATELRELEAELQRMEDFMHSPETQRQVQEYSQIQESITELERTRIPLQVAYKYYGILSTATSSLIGETIWAPMMAEDESILFAGLRVEGLTVHVLATVENLEIQRQYQLALAEKTVTVDRYNIDKRPGAAREEGDQEISRFRDRFTFEYFLETTDGINPYETLLGVRINKNVPDAVFDVIGGSL